MLIFSFSLKKLRAASLASAISSFKFGTLSHSPLSNESDNSCSYSSRSKTGFLSFAIPISPSFEIFLCCSTARKNCLYEKSIVFLAKRNYISVIVYLDNKHSLARIFFLVWVSNNVYRPMLLQNGNNFFKANSPPLDKQSIFLWTKFINWFPKYRTLVLCYMTNVNTNYWSEGLLWRHAQAAQSKAHPLACCGWKPKFTGKRLRRREKGERRRLCYKCGTVGIEKGRQAKYSDIWQIAARRAKLEDAKEMLSENLDIELIKRITKLTENDLADLDISEK